MVTLIHRAFAASVSLPLNGKVGRCLSHFSCGSSDAVRSLRPLRLPVEKGYKPCHAIAL